MREVNEPERWKIRINNIVERLLQMLIVGCFIFIWKMYEAQQDFLRKQDQTDTQVIQLQKDVSRIEGNMVTMETLKRVEIYMELILARAGIKTTVDLTSEGLKK